MIGDGKKVLKKAVRCVNIVHTLIDLRYIYIYIYIYLLTIHTITNSLETGVASIHKEWCFQFLSSVNVSEVIR